MAARKPSKAAKDKPQGRRTMDVARDAKGRILPGHTLNPGGMTDAEKQARAMVRAGAVDVVGYLLNVVRGVEESDQQTRSKVALGLLPYCVPKMPEAVEVSGSLGAISSVDAETLRKLAAAG